MTFTYDPLPGWLLVSPVCPPHDPASTYAWRVEKRSEHDRITPFAPGDLVMVNHAMPWTYVSDGLRLVHADWVIATVEALP